MSKLNFKCFISDDRQYIQVLFVSGTIEPNTSTSRFQGIQGRTISESLTEKEFDSQYYEILQESIVKKILHIQDEYKRSKLTGHRFAKPGFKIKEEFTEVELQLIEDADKKRNKNIFNRAKKMGGLYKSPTLETKLAELGINKLVKKNELKIPFKMRIVGHRFAGAFVNKLMEDLSKNTKIDRFMFDYGVIDSATFGSTSIIQNIISSKKEIRPSEYKHFFKMKHGQYDVRSSLNIEVTDDTVYENKFVPFIQVMDRDDEVTILRSLIVPDSNSYDDILNIQWGEHTSDMNYFLKIEQFVKGGRIEDTQPKYESIVRNNAITPKLPMPHSNGMKNGIRQAFSANQAQKSRSLQFLKELKELRKQKPPKQISPPRSRSLPPSRSSSPHRSLSPHRSSSPSRSSSPHRSSSPIRSSFMSPSPPPKKALKEKADKGKAKEKADKEKVAKEKAKKKEKENAAKEKANKKDKEKEKEKAAKEKAKKADKAKAAKEKAKKADKAKAKKVNKKR
jgi:hypothetical protein